MNSIPNVHEYRENEQEKIKQEQIKKLREEKLQNQQDHTLSKDKSNKVVDVFE